MKCEQWWSMSDGWGRPSVLAEITQTLYVWRLSCWSVALTGIPKRNILVKKMSMVGPDYLQVTMYMHHNVHLQSFNLMVGRFKLDDIWIFWALPNWVSMFQNSSERFMYYVFNVAWSCFSHCLIFYMPGSVCHCTWYSQSCIWVSSLSPIFPVVYFWSRLCLLVGKKVVSCLWFSVHY